MSKSLYTTIIETSAPTTSTVGIVGQKYLDSSTQKYYVCTAIDTSSSTYTWEELATLNDVWPINSIYISVDNTSPASLFGGTWEALSEGYTLWTTTTSGQGGETISAGLPNINGTICGGDSDYRSGAFVSSVANGSKVGSGTAQFRTFTFDASNSNSIYGNSDTVQPPAIKVYAWKRTA